MNEPHAHGGPECLALFERLSEYLDGEINPLVCAGVERHLRDCDRCQVFLESLRRAVAHVASVSPAALPDDLRREILAAYRAARARQEGGA